MNLNLIRVLFPKWDFFDRVGHHFELRCRIKNSDLWKETVIQHKLSMTNFFLNPIGNMKMAQIHILENFVQNTEDESSLKMIQSLVGVYQKDKIASDESVQFKIVAIRGEEQIDVYTSDWFLLRTS